jgi:2-succinyl-5-enolpyruvyl-6-hydroxy-3-cyclohexene-1-carboxylate synthase
VSERQTANPQGSNAPDIGCLNLRWCAALLDGLAAAGMTTLVLSPGSRSTPVVLAAQRHAELDIVPILDERSAAFFALGVALASGRPVALLATSGSAPAHWYPAVIEASEAGVPLILLSADRPPRLRNWGANQTIDQTRLFGAFVREQHDPGLPQDDAAALKAMRALGLRAGSISVAPNPGPVHLNLPFEEPLLPAGDCQPEPAPRPDAQPRMRLSSVSSGVSRAVSAASFEFTSPRGRGLIVCGPSRFDDDFSAALDHCARHLGLPVLADPLSGLRFGPDSVGCISGYDALLRNAKLAGALRPDWVLRFGRAPVSKRLGQWLDGIPSILVDPAGVWSDPSHDLIQRYCAEPTVVCKALASSDAAGADHRWRDDWLAADQRIAERASRHLAESPWCEGHLIRGLMARIPAGEALLCANSMPIRQIDTWSGTRTAPLTLFGNRGVSGIDGQLSTLAGLNHAGLHDDIGPTWALLGDLSLCHDLSGLLLSARMRRPIIVINNQGGRIFDYLPQHGRPGFEELWRTPVDIDLGALAATFGLPHIRVHDAAAFDQALDDALQHDQAGQLIEVVIDGDLSRRVHTQFWSLTETD